MQIWKLWKFHIIKVDMKINQIRFPLGMGILGFGLEPGSPTQKMCIFNQENTISEFGCES